MLLGSYDLIFLEERELYGAVIFRFSDAVSSSLQQMKH